MADDLRRYCLIHKQNLRLSTRYRPSRRETPDIQHTLFYAFEVPTVRRISRFVSSQGKPLQPACRRAPNVLLPGPRQEPREEESSDS